MTMPLPESCDAECGGEKSRILTWIEVLEPNPPEILKAHNNRRKRSCQRSNSIPNPSKRRTGTRRVKGSPLAPTSGNIMPSHVEKGQTLSQTPQGKRRRSPRKQHPANPPNANDNTQEDKEELDEETPRPQGSKASSIKTSQCGPPRAVRLSPPVYGGQELENARPASPSRDSFSSLSETISSSNRSTSPTKQLADLEWAERPTTYEALDGNSAESAGGTLIKYLELVEASRGIGVIPISLKPFVEQNLHIADWPPAHAYTTRHAPEWDHTFGQKVLEIHKAAIGCERKGESEVTWNAKVHEPLYELAVADPRYKAQIGCTNITTARIQPKSLRMTHTSGMKMSGRVVDFAFYIEPDYKLKSAIRDTLRGELKEAQSVNQTMYAQLRMCPIAISVETKVPFSGGEIADVQLATWASAGLTKLRQMLPPHEAIPTIPALVAHGHDLHFVAFQEKVGENVMYGRLDLGSTGTLLGTFQMLRSLDILLDWVINHYRPWYLEKVVAPR